MYDIRSAQTMLVMLFAPNEGQHRFGNLSGTSGAYQIHRLFGLLGSNSPIQVLMDGCCSWLACILTAWPRRPCLTIFKCLKEERQLKSCQSAAIRHSVIPNFVGHCWAASQFEELSTWDLPQLLPCLCQFDTPGFNFLQAYLAECGPVYYPCARHLVGL